MENTTLKVADKDKTLVIFDFDLTLIDSQSYDSLLNLLEDSENVIKSIKSKLESNFNWFNFNQEVFKEMKNQKIDADKIKLQLKDKLTLTDNFKELLDYLYSNKEHYEVIIMSATINYIIHWIMDHNGYKGLISHVHSNKCLIDKDNYFEYIKINCDKCLECGYFLCKNRILKQILNNKNEENNEVSNDNKKKYKRILYAGDGANDYCAALLLKESDVLYFRKDYKLHDKLKVEEHKNRIKCSLVEWECGKGIHDHIIENNLK